MNKDKDKDKDTDKDKDKDTDKDKDKDKDNKGKGKKEKEVPLRRVVHKRGTTKVVACDSVDTGFDYLLFSDSKPLLQSVHAAVTSSSVGRAGNRFRSTFQPKISSPVYESGDYMLGLRVQAGADDVGAGADDMALAGTAITCETLRQVLESRPEIRCIEHDALLGFTKTLYAQVYALETAHRRAVPYFSLDDVVVIHDALALFVNDDKLFEIHPDETIDVTRAIGREDGSFYPPDLSGEGGGKLVSLPYTVTTRCAYYSFGMLVAYCATLNPALLMKHSAVRKVALKKEGVLDPIQGTKLYWFILRCCASNPANRRMIYV